MQYLTEKDITTLNVYVISMYSPKEQMGVKDPDTLNILANASKQYVFRETIEPILELESARLVRCLLKKHVFFNGNKRTALISLAVLLNINGYQLTVSNEEAADYMVKVITDDLQEVDISKWIEVNIKPIVNKL